MGGAFMNRPVWFVLMLLLGVYEVFTADHTNVSPPLKSVVKQHARQPRCKNIGRVIDCHVDMLDDNIDFRNYTGQIYRVSVYCNKSSFLPSRLTDGCFEQLGSTLEVIAIYDCYFIDISRNAFRGTEQLRSLYIKGVSNFQTDTFSTLDSANLSENELVLPHDTSMARHDILMLPDGLFSELGSLTRLDLIAMRLNSSVWHEIENLGNLQNLYLSNNDITTIDISTTSKLKNLTLLQLDGNFIQVILNGSLLFKGLTWLLDLSSNRIRFIESDTFKDLSKLASLLLSGNFISALEVNIFTGLSSLHSLYLSGNSIQVVKKDTFKDLSKLGILDLSKNSISTVEKDTFEGLIELKYLDLSGNSIKVVKMDTFKRLSKLASLDLSWNSISTVEIDAFKELSNLYTLDLSGNSIRTVKMNIFEGLIGLQRLSMADNQITTIAQHTLEQLTSLLHLNLSNNKIQTFPKFPSSLNSLDLRNNYTVELDNNSFPGLLHLSSLDMSHNKLKSCRQYNIPDTVRILNLSSNVISVASFTLTRELKYVDLRNNQLKSFAIDSLKEYRYADLYGDIYLSGNPGSFQCVCNLEVVNNLSTFNYGRWNVMKYHIWNFTSVNCSSKNKHEPGGITKVHLKTFSCQYKKSCPDHCTCYHWRYKDKVIIVNCQSAGLIAVPVTISASCTILDLAGNMFLSLMPGNFDGLSQLVELYLNSNNITEIMEGTFRDLSSLTKLNLSNNSVSRLELGIFKSLKRLSSLDLSFNKIIVIVDSTFKYLNVLKNLNLAGNELETISSSDIECMHTITSLKLSNNPWSCDCTFLEVFKPFISENKNHIKDYLDIVCLTSNKTEYHLYQIYLGKICSDIEQPKDKKNIAEIALYSIVSVTVFSIICFCIVFKNREFIKVWLFVKCGWTSAHSESEEMNKQYDAFVSYSSRDEDFILRELMPHLEQPRQGRLGYKLCVHFRDFPVGRHIPETIHNVVEDSRRVIMILSDNFLSSEWCQYEFQAAHHQLLLEKRSRIIMVLLHDINSDLLDRQLKMYLRTRTYVKYGDPLFWDKLEFAMPERQLPAEENLDAENIADQADSILVVVEEESDDDAQLIN